MTAGRKDRSARAAAGGRRELLFLLSPRIVSFDTFLPVAMQIAASRPGWRLRFISFDRKSFEAIGRNTTLIAGLERCGTLHFIGNPPGAGPIARARRRAMGMAKLAFWIVRARRPVVFSSRPFTDTAYAILYLLARARGGNGYLLWKNRSPDEVHRIMFQVREPPQPRPLPWLARRLSRHQDAIIHYHDQQPETLGMSAVFGRIDDVPRIRIGLPHLFAAWQELVTEQVAAERKNLTRDGVDPDGEIYTIFAAKPGSGANLGTPGSIERVFEAVLSALRRLRPGASILIRAHPAAVDAAYIQKGLAEGGGQVRLSFAHPEVVAQLSRRCIANNPTNVLFAGFPGNFIDCSEYPDLHFAQVGEVSLAHGYGPIYIDPRKPDFEGRLAQALADDAPFRAAGIRGKLDRMVADNPVNMEALLDLLGGPGDRAPPANADSYPMDNVERNTRAK
ncbi:MAG: hypothetical protein ACTSUD_12465 [Alphaproteobacteria bacterium]